MIAAILLGALAQTGLMNAAPRVEIIVAATSVVVIGSNSARGVTASATGIPQPVIASSGTTTTITDRSPGTRVLRGTYEIVVPASATVYLRVRCTLTENDPCPNATVRVTGVKQVVYESTDGRATISDISGDVNATSLHGSVSILRVAGSVDAASQTNAINVSNARGRVVVRSITGMIALESLMAGAQATNTTGEIKLSGAVTGGARYELTTDVGQIRLYLADGAGATIDVNANPDAVRVRTQGARSTGNGERRRTVVVGNGSARVSARTLSGGVDIGRR